MDWIFKKKKEELKFPAEKEEALKEAPKPVVFGEFKKPEELMPPPQPKVPTSLPPFERPEPIPMPKIEPKPIEAKAKPSIFIKVSKYREVMDKIASLGKEIENMKRQIEELEGVEKQEMKEIEEAKDAIKKLEEIINYLRQVFTNPEA